MTLHISYTAERPDQITLGVDGSEYSLKRLQALQVARDMMNFVFDNDYEFCQDVWENMVNMIQVDLELLQ
jgi:hypothetical protein